MHIINERRTVPLTSRAGAGYVGCERVVGFDARLRGHGVVYERHLPMEVASTGNGFSDAVPIVNQRPVQRLLPYLIAPLIAIIVKQLFRAKG